MNISDLFNILFLGGASSNPSIVLYNISEQKQHTLMNIQTKSSIYAMDFNIENSTLAAATKDGFIYIINIDQHQTATEDTSKYSFIHKAPVISVCWAGKSVLAVSDTTGQCLLLNTDSCLPQQSLETDNNPICSLKKINDNTLAGFSSSGELFFWHPTQGQLIETVDIACPPPVGALIEMIYQEDQKQLILPAAGGYLIFFDTTNSSITRTKAHTGDFYATALYKDMIITAGMNDSTLKIWSSDPKIKKPVSCHNLTEGIISIAVVGNQQDMFVCVDKNGKAWLYTICNNSLSLIKRLGDQDCRTVLSPDANKIHKLYEQKKESEVMEITRSIQNNSGNISDTSITALHTRLEQLGFKHVSLALKAEQAELDENNIECLNQLYQLTTLLPQDDPRGHKTLEYYTTVLERNWQFTEADEIYGKIRQLKPEHSPSVDTARINKAASLIISGNGIVHPDIPIEQIIQAANVINSNFTGRYIIKKLDLQQFGGINIEPEMILEKYNLIKEKEGPTHLPSAAVEQLTLITQTEIEKIKTVSFCEGTGNGVEGLQFILQVSSSEHGSVLTPFIVFNFRTSESHPQVHENNTKACGTLYNITSSALTNTYIDSIYKTAMFSVNMLITEHLSQKRRRL